MPLLGFYAHPKMADGRLNKCKECTKKDATAHRNANIDYVLTYDKRRGMLPHRVEARRAYIKTDAGKRAHNKAAGKWAETNIKKVKAIQTLNNAIRDGKIKKWPICALPECFGKPQAHHPDYDQPFAVVWLCPAHHKKAHSSTEKT